MLLLMLLLLLCFCYWCCFCYCCFCYCCYCFCWCYWCRRIIVLYAWQRPLDVTDYWLIVLKWRTNEQRPPFLVSRRLISNCSNWQAKMRQKVTAANTTEMHRVRDAQRWDMQRYWDKLRDAELHRVDTILFASNVTITQLYQLNHQNHYYQQ